MRFGAIRAGDRTRRIDAIVELGQTAPCGRARFLACRSPEPVAAGRDVRKSGQHAELDAVLIYDDNRADVAGEIARDLVDI
ncbi:MAG TPA: hypothetical protein VFT74_07735 [Isosphaeraceae bacterium]|nr:hypothetical protein [Isosphaeraceae bacterium]